MKALLVLGVLTGLLGSAAPAWGQTAAAFDGLESIADTQRRRAGVAPTKSAQQCRERDRAFLVRNRMSPSQRREVLDRCLAVAQMPAPPALAAPDPVAESSYTTR